MPEDLIQLSDDGEAAFDITDAASGVTITPEDLMAFIRDEDAEDANNRHHYRCRKCGSTDCAVEDNMAMGSSWTGPYGSVDLVCRNRKCGASLELYGR